MVDVQIDEVGVLGDDGKEREFVEGLQKDYESNADILDEGKRYQANLRTSLELISNRDSLWQKKESLSGEEMDKFRRAGFKKVVELYRLPREEGKFDGAIKAIYRGETEKEAKAASSGKGDGPSQLKSYLRENRDLLGIEVL
jgi:hypothetical protein